MATNIQKTSYRIIAMPAGLHGRILPGRYSLFVIIGDANIDRIKAYDPLEIPTVTDQALVAPSFPGWTLKDVVIAYAPPKIFNEIDKGKWNDRVPELIQLLSVGFQYRPDRGDHDKGPQPG